MSVKFWFPGICFRKQICLSLAWTWEPTDEDQIGSLYTDTLGIASYKKLNNKQKMYIDGL